MALTTETQPAVIRPGVVIDGRTYYPTGRMYLFAFAFAGYQWAIDAINTDPNFREQLKYELADTGFIAGAGI